jgi:DNA-directed RNA polymerase specialized sigma24 family protein
MAVEDAGEVTEALGGLKAGADRERAVQTLWEHAFDKLVKFARGVLRDMPRGASDEEDVALSAFQSLCDGVARGRFPELHDRDNLWRVLYTITRRKDRAHVTHEKAQKRGAGRGADANIEALEDDEPTPEFAALMADELRSRLAALGDDTLRRIAVLLLENASNDEIAVQLGCSTRTIERKRERIRKAWERDVGQALA